VVDSSSQHLFFELFDSQVANVPTFDDVDDKFGDVRGMVANALDGLGDKQIFKAGRDCPRGVAQMNNESAHKCTKFIVDDFVVANDLRSGDDIHSCECVEGVAQDAQRHLARTSQLDDICFIELASLSASTLQAVEIGDSCRRKWVMQALLPVRNNLKPLENGEHYRHRGPCTAIAARNGDATAVTLNQVLDQSESDSET